MTAFGAQSYHAFCTAVTVPKTIQPNIFTTHVIPDEDDNESFQPKDPVKPHAQEEDNQEKGQPKSNNLMTAEPQTTLVNLCLITHVIPDDQEPTSLDPHDELLCWHYHLGHLSFECIKQLVRLGQLPKHLLASKKPVEI